MWFITSLSRGFSDSSFALTGADLDKNGAGTVDEENDCVDRSVPVGAGTAGCGMGCKLVKRLLVSAVVTVLVGLLGKMGGMLGKVTIVEDKLGLVLGKTVVELARLLFKVFGFDDFLSFLKILFSFFSFLLEALSCPI